MKGPARLWNVLRRPTDTPGRRYSYHRLRYIAAPLLLGVVLLAPLSVAGVILAAVLLAAWLAGSAHEQGE